MNYMKICISLRLNNMKQTLMCLIKEALELLKDLFLHRSIGLEIIRSVQLFKCTLFFFC